MSGQNDGTPLHVQLIDNSNLMDARTAGWLCPFSSSLVLHALLDVVEQH